MTDEEVEAEFAAEYMKQMKPYYDAEANKNKGGITL